MTMFPIVSRQFEVFARSALPATLGARKTRLLGLSVQGEPADTDFGPVNSGALPVESHYQRVLGGCGQVMSDSALVGSRSLAVESRYKQVFGGSVTVLLGCWVVGKRVVMVFSGARAGLKRWVTGLSGAAGSEKVFKLLVAGGKTKLTLTSYGGGDNADRSAFGMAAVNASISGWLIDII